MTGTGHVRGGEAWGQALPRMWSIKTGLAAAGIHYLADRFRALLARLVGHSVSPVVTSKERTTVNQYTASRR
jgi:hypothetical protein